MMGSFRWFVVLSLSLAAVLKVGTVLSSEGNSAAFLGYPEPLVLFFLGIPVPMNAALLIEALGEAAVVVLLNRSDLRTQMSITAFVGTIFLIYHLLLAETGYKGPCPCFGNAYRWLGLSFRTVNAVVLCQVLIMVVVSYGWLTVGWLKGHLRVSDAKT